MDNDKPQTPTPSLTDLMGAMAAAQAAQEPFFLGRLRGHFGADPRTLPVVAEEFPALDHVLAPGRAASLSPRERSAPPPHPQGRRRGSGSRRARQPRGPEATRRPTRASQDRGSPVGPGLGPTPPTGSDPSSRLPEIRGKAPDRDGSPPRNSPARDFCDSEKGPEDSSAFPTLSVCLSAERGSAVAQRGGRGGRGGARRSPAVLRGGLRRRSARRVRAAVSLRDPRGAAEQQGRRAC